MFKLLFLLFLAWLAWRMIKAGRFVRGLMRTMEESIAAAQGQDIPRPPTQERPDDGSRITVHRKGQSGGKASTLDAEDVRFEDL
ncbi:MAG: hypothetical protein HKN29_16120 [Rhodothermales bacterium]|nr:hypothetical protein [Rhodothermales bacterium]